MIHGYRNVSQEVRTNTAAGEKYYYSKKIVMRSRILSQKSKFQIYLKSFITYI